MKANKLFRKLALSGVALGAAAVTLTATTFAWYTSNTEADVAAVTAQTEAKSSASLFIATADTYDEVNTDVETITGYKQATHWKDYLATATPVVTGAKTAPASAPTAYVLKPVYSNYDSVNIAEATTNPAVAAVAGRSYNRISGATGTNKDTATFAEESANDFMEFVFRVRTSAAISSAKKLYFSEFNLSSAATESGVAITQIPLAVGDSVGIPQKTAYGADLLKALKLDITSADVTLGENSAIPVAGVTTRKAGTSAEANAVATYGFESMGGADTNIKENGAAALAYYNTVMGTSLSVPATDYNAGTETTKIVLEGKTAEEIASQKTGKSPVEVGTIPATATGMDFSVLEIRFVLYLDGWDNYCYDIMQGQTVNFSFQLTTEESKAILYKPTTQQP